MDKIKIPSDLEPVVEAYFSDGAKRLYKMVDQILFRLSFKDIEKNDFYSLANEVFLYTVRDYDSAQSFDGFLYSNLYKKFCSEMTASRRFKRCRKIKIEKIDKHGNIVIKEVIVPDARLDEPLVDDENTTLEDIIPCDKTVESEIFGEEEGYSQKMLTYLGRLSNLQKSVLRLIVAGYSPREIREELHINEKQYVDCSEAIHSYKNVSLLF